MAKLYVNWRRAFGLLMLGLGVYLLVEMYVLGNAPKAGPKSVATIFAMFFVLRGALYVRMSRTRNKPDLPQSP